MAFRKISCSSLCSRSPHLEIWCIITLWPRIWLSCVRYLGVAFGVQRIGFFGRCCDSLGAMLGSTVDSFSASVFCMRSSRDFLSGAMLGSTVDTCSASVLGLGRISHIFHVAVDSNPVAWSPFSRRVEKCAQHMLQSSVLLAMRIFWGTCVRHRCRVLPVPRESDSRVFRHTMHN